MQTQKIKGAFLLLTSAAMFSIMSCLVKTTSEVSPFTTTFMRFVIGLVIICMFALTGHIHLRFRNWRLLLLRGILGSAGIFITYSVIIKIGLSKSTVILYSYPIFASLFGAYFLKEKLRGINFAAMAIAVVGLYLLVTRVNGIEGFLRIGLYEFIAMAGMLIYSLVVVIIRKLHETETTYEILFAQCSIGTAILIIPSNMGQSVIGANEMIVLLLIGILATLGQLTMTQGFRYLPVKTASLLTTSQLIFNYIAGIVIFNESLTMRAFIGSALIFTACFAVLLSREKT